MLGESEVLLLFAESLGLFVKIQCMNGIINQMQSAGDLTDMSENDSMATVNSDIKRLQVIIAKIKLDGSNDDPKLSYFKSQILRLEKNLKKMTGLDFTYQPYNFKIHQKTTN